MGFIIPEKNHCKINNILNVKNKTEVMFFACNILKSIVYVKKKANEIIEWRYTE